MVSNENVLIPKKTSEELLYTTVRIVGLSAEKKESVGTGFLFNIDLGDRRIITLILTNKHVIDNNTQLSFHLHEGTVVNDKLQPTGKFIAITMQDYQNKWIPHPDVNIDLGALLFSPIETNVKNELKKVIFYRTFDKSLIKSDADLKENTSVAEEVLMVGYPIGLWDDYNNFPIIRKGITATHPASNFQNKSVGIVDIACFPGSSGSPILIYMHGTYSSGSNGEFSIGTKIVLLGLLYAGPSYTTEGRIEVKEIPAQCIPITINRQMMHLGYYVKAKEILILCDHILSKYAADINQSGTLRS